MALRAIPNLMDLRPADPAETAMAWRVALERTDGPSFLALTRQKVPMLDRSQGTDAEGLRRGGYVLGDAHGALEAVLIASGSEVQVAVQARELLHGHGIGTRVVSLPSWYLFSRQTDAYQRSVLGDDACDTGLGRSGSDPGLGALDRTFGGVRRPRPIRGLSTRRRSLRGFRVQPKGRRRACPPRWSRPLGRSALPSEAPSEPTRIIWSRTRWRVGSTPTPRARPRAPAPGSRRPTSRPSDRPSPSRPPPHGSTSPASSPLPPVAAARSG